MRQEIWTDILGYEGKYKVSNMGRVMNPRRNKILKPCIDKDGYCRVNLYIGSAKSFKPIHRLVAIAFIDNPLNLPQVNHKNGNKSDNRHTELEWVTVKQNVIHSFATGLKRGVDVWGGKFGYESSRGKEVVQIDSLGMEVATFGSMLEAERKTGVASESICSMIKGRLKTAGGYTWRHA